MIKFSLTKQYSVYKDNILYINLRFSSIIEWNYPDYDKQIYKGIMFDFYLWFFCLQIWFLPFTKIETGK